MKTVNFGIDLGTTNSLIGKYEEGKVVLYKNPIGHKDTLASVVAFRKERTLVGDKAREYIVKDPVNVFSGFKRRMGTDDRFYVVNLDENVTPIELSAFILRELKNFIHTNEIPEAVVITIPASFDTMQTNATKEAGKLAGFEEVFLLQEPIAASLAYFNNSKEDKEGNWLVYDLGGGTFDIALVQIKEGEMKIKDHEGNNFLGGVDFDALIIEHLIVPKIVEKTGISDFAEQLMTKHGKYEKIYYHLLYLAEEVKKELSTQAKSEIDLSMEIDGVFYDLTFPISVDDFNSLISPKIEETLEMLQTIINRNNLQPQDIHEIILVGGSTYIPWVREQLNIKTGIPVNNSIDPTTAVAVGACFYAASKFYTPTEKVKMVINNQESNDFLENLENFGDPQEEKPNIKLNLGFSQMSKEEEEVLLVKVEGDYQGLNYRIMRMDGGFDTGLIPLKSKFTEFLPLLTNTLNHFIMQIYSSNGEKINSFTEEFSINQGQFHILGQPLPKDICIEIDDQENYKTKLEVIFEKNSILPLKKTLYREVSKTVVKGSEDSIVINLLEGDRFARAISNLPIGCIEITGKDLTSDLIKGSDIEIQISISDDRELKVNTFLVMTQQEFTNNFSISEKHISISRLKEQYQDLEKELRKNLKDFNFNQNEIWAIELENLLKKLEISGKQLMTLKENDATDKRYILADTMARISQEVDKIGGKERLSNLQFKYIEIKEYIEEILSSADENKEILSQRYTKIIEKENDILKSKNSSFLQKNIELLEDLQWEILWNTYTYITGRFYALQSLQPEEYKNYKAAQQLIKAGEDAIKYSHYKELKRLMIDLIYLTKQSDYYKQEDNKKFKGTGIG
ncbi:hypothetical protein ETU09_04575 [Apibacter muscae]|uniref:Hsp70 family protein n=1 Tax=Apibacter muscae TaxID=2509004 RepID=A0A563DGG5_9FLAO|nr:Hsp70 family protein [Apibacter muscae]TWP29121.1 hypothetical protein ETU09_04575 [Apibacter muscae]